ncbi:MAG TPA: BatD family protein, partial [Thermodesulfobacteriota bacterium]|nr:BatD family protein [Thermodesulfobacteriota bacterium]
LKPGKMNIPAYVFQGKVQSDREREDFFSRRMRDAFGKFDDFDNFPGFASFEPFTLSGQEITLDVKPPAAGTDRWLPLTSLKISDDLDGAASAKVGEPLTRKLKLVAQGATGATLPDLEGSIAPDGSFRIYADKPSSGEKISADGSTITGWREESYTLIPEKSGALTLPEIKVPWWDVKSNRIAYATVPARTIDVAPGKNVSEARTETVSQPQQQNENTSQTGNTMPGSGSKTTSIGIAQTWLSQPNSLFMILGALVLAVLVLAVLVIYLFRRLSQEKKHGQFDGESPRGGIKTYSPQGKLSPNDLYKTRTPEELRNFLGTYANQHWDAPPNASLQTILSIIAARGLQNELPEIKRVFFDLDTALYAGGHVDIEDMKNRLGGILKAADKMKATTDKQRADMRGLNPT